MRKINKKFKKKFNKELTVMIFVCMFFVIMLGYAILSQTLLINGFSKINNSTWNVHFNNPSPATTGSVAIDTSVYSAAKAATKDSDTQVSYNIMLKKPGDFYEFTVPVQNEGSIDAMIDLVSSKIKIDDDDEYEITSNNLPTWLNYSITYEDGLPIEVNNRLAAGDTEVLKVRVELKRNILNEEYEAALNKLLQFKFNLNYVQENSNVATNVLHMFSGTKYGVYPVSGALKIEDVLNPRTSLYLQESDAIKYWNNLGSNKQSLYLKQVIDNNVVKESYVVFKISNEIKNNLKNKYCSGDSTCIESINLLNNGTYELRGGINESSLDNRVVFVQNAKKLYDAFGTNCSSNPYTTTPVDYFSCRVSGFHAGVDNAGNVDVDYDNSIDCSVYSDGESYCNVIKKDNNGEDLNNDTNTETGNEAGQYDNVQALIADTNLRNGDFVSTKGYYSKSLGGAAKYAISDNQDGFNSDTDFALENGLYAKLIIENNTVTVNQYGAYGDGIHDDSVAIKKAINSGNSIVKFEGKRYKCNSNIVLGTSNVILEGNNSVLFIDDDYYESVGANYFNQYYFFSINSNINNGVDLESSMLENITIKDLTFEHLITKPDTTDTFSCKVQMRVYNVTGLVLDGVDFLVPEIEGNKDRGVMSLWLYSGWKDVVIRNSRFINKTKRSTDTCAITVGSRNYNYVSSNLLIENNYVFKKGHDEIIAVFAGKMKNIIIRNNEFYEDDSEVGIPSDMLFSFGYGDSDELIENIQFINNKIDTNSELSLFSVRAYSTNPRNVIIKNNNIKHKILNQVERLGGYQDAQFIFTNNSSSTSEIVTLENNKINLTVESPSISFSFAKYEVVLIDNDIRINGNLSNFIYNTSKLKIDNNIIKLKDGCNFLIKNVYALDFKNNKLVIDKTVGDNIISYSTREMIGSVVLNNNNITIKDSNVWTKNKKALLLVYNVDMKNYTILIKNNTFDLVNQTNAQMAANVTGMVVDSVDLIRFSNNELDKFTNINYWNNTGNVNVLME